jgi:hypothetical protein
MTNRHDAVALLERANPVEPDQIADETDIVAAHERVRHLIAARAQAYPAAPTPIARRRLRVAALIVAGIVTLLLLVAALPGHGRRPGLGVLNATAAVAATQPSTIAPSGKYFHVLEQEVGYAPVGRRSNLQVSYEWWVAADGAGRLVYRSAPWGPGSAPPGCGCHQSGKTLVTGRTFEAGQFAGVYRRYVDLADAHPIDPNSLPVETTALKARLQRRGLLLPQIAWLLANPMDSPALRSALFRVAAQTPGVTTHPRATDPVGRIGEAMDASLLSTIPQPKPKAGWPTFRAIFDPRTSEILAWEVILHAGSTTWVQSRTFLERGIVSSTHSVP